MMTQETSLVGQILIAMPTLADPNFWRTVVLVSVHSPEDGAFGLVINRSLDVDPDEILSGLGDNITINHLPRVLSGGPVEPTHGFVLFEDGQPLSDENAVSVGDAVRISGSAETLAELVQGEIASRFYLLLGYSGWAPGQLEREIEENSWLVAPLDPTILFDVPLEERWTAALRSIGVDPGTLVDLGSAEPS